MSPREISLTRPNATRASGYSFLIRRYVGLIFAGQGVLRFVRSDDLGPGRFIKGGIPAGTFWCGLLILVGLFTRLATLPMIVGVDAYSLDARTLADDPG